MVVALLNRFGLSDALVMDSYYSSNPRPDGKDWPGLLTKLRGALTHEGYFRIADGTIAMDDLISVGRHWQDLLTRILLKILGYDGTYQPTVLVWTSPQTTDWVTSATSAERLGYGPSDD
jgi:hypothetical protein